MLETTKQAAIQETLTREGSMISLSDKRGIQLEDSARHQKRVKKQQSESRKDKKSNADVQNCNFDVAAIDYQLTCRLNSGRYQNRLR